MDKINRMLSMGLKASAVSPSLWVQQMVLTYRYDLLLKITQTIIIVRDGTLYLSK